MRWRVDRRGGGIARGKRGGDRGVERRQPLFDVGQAVDAQQALGRRRAAAEADEPVPAPHRAIARDQPLPDGKRWPVVALDHRDLRQPPLELGRGVDMVEQSLEPSGQRRIVGLRVAAVPAPRSPSPPTAASRSSPSAAASARS